ncbi:MAG: UvrD-helicase domain-containing protein [Zavarzinella sp.]
MSNEKSPILADLTEEQLEAVTHLHGPLLVLAGAGSGKTRVITRRVAWLLEQGVRPSNILAITFTNKAAGEMKQRVEAVVPGNQVWVSTFHSLGVRLLRQYADRIGISRDFSIFDVDDRTKLVKLSMERANIDNVKITPEQVGHAISKAKNLLLTPEKYARSNSDYFTSNVAMIYSHYQKRMREANAMDFDDLLYIPALLLKHDEEIRAELDARFRYILIDEYQDTNTAQYELAKALSKDYRNLCVVGDPDQSIYRWRGSDIRNILDFEKDFPEAKVVTLAKNYRSTPAILHAASHLIANNRERKKKTLIASKPEGAPVRHLVFETGQHEAASIAQLIKKSVQLGLRRYRDIAIFVRMNALTRSLETSLIHQGVPFQIVKGLAFFDRKENKDVIAYLRLLVNPTDTISFLRVVNEPARGIGKVSLDHLQTYAEDNQVSLLEAAANAPRIPAIRGKAVHALKSFAQMIYGMQANLSLAPADLIAHVIETSGYRDMYATSRDPDDQERLANIEELITSAREFSNQLPTGTLQDFLEQITLASDVDNWNEKSDCVSVMTMHASKGLEFPVVYIVAMEQGILPGSRSLDPNKPEELEEERRVAFVGMTRAMDELYLCSAQLRDFRGQTNYAIVSQFIEELPEDVIQQDFSSNRGRQPAFESWRTKMTRELGESSPRERDEEISIFRPAKKTAGSGDTSSGGGDLYPPGTLVMHDEYGLGTVREVSGIGAMRKIKIQFARGGMKTFVAAKAKLTVIPPK